MSLRISSVRLPHAGDKDILQRRGNDRQGVQAYLGLLQHSLDAWLEDARPRLTPGVELTVYDESWQLIKERIMLLVKNGLGDYQVASWGGGSHADL